MTNTNPLKSPTLLSSNSAFPGVMFYSSATVRFQGISLDWSQPTPKTEMSRLCFFLPPFGKFDLLEIKYDKPTVSFSCRSATVIQGLVLSFGFHQYWFNSPMWTGLWKEDHHSASPGWLKNPDWRIWNHLTKLIWITKLLAQIQALSLSPEKMLFLII